MNGAALDIAVKNLACRRGERLLFKGLSFDASSGTLTEIVGPNGIGKTSLLRILAGLLGAEAGTVSLREGGRLLGKDDEPANRLHYLGHQDALKSQLTVRENLAFAHALFAGRGGAEEALTRLGLVRQADLPIGVLSAGQRRRAALARCAMLGRPLWLLDEPTASLDANGRTLVADLIGAHIAGGGTVIAATHEAMRPDARRVAIA